jgi:hypothetical protein
MTASPGGLPGNPTSIEDNPDMQGEGNYIAGRRYNEATGQFVEDGRVGPAARDAAPTTADLEKELQRAEEVGRSHARK